MASERGRGGWSYDPLVAGIREGVAAGYDALDYVLEGLRASVERRGGPGSREHGTRHGEGRHGGRWGRGAPQDVVDEVASVVAEIIGLLGEVAQETAESITERARPARRGERVPLELKAKPGNEATVDFHVWNTSSTVLHGIELGAGELIDGERRIPADAVRFIPAHIDRILPGRRETAEVVVTVPPDAAPGTYHGIVQAEPGGAWAVIELTVIPEDDESEYTEYSEAMPESFAPATTEVERQPGAATSEMTGVERARRARRGRLYR